MKQTYEGEELAILRALLARLRSEPEADALVMLGKFAEMVANQSFLEAIAEAEAPANEGEALVETEAPNSTGGEEMGYDVADLKDNMVKAFAQPVIASRTKATGGQTLADLLAPTLDRTEVKSLSTAPMSAGTAGLLRAAGLGDVVDVADGQARALKSVLAAPADGAGMLPGGLQAWIRGDDQPVATEAQVAQAEAQAQRMGEHARRVLQGGAPASVAQGDGNDPRYRASWVRKQTALAAQARAQFGRKPR